MNYAKNVQLFGLPAEKGRWFYVLLGLLVLLCLGTVYSWSIFRKPLESLFKIGATQSLLPFTLQKQNQSQRVRRTGARRHYCG